MRRQNTTKRRSKKFDNSPSGGTLQEHKILLISLPRLCLRLCCCGNRHHGAFVRKQQGQSCMPPPSFPFHGRPLSTPSDNIPLSLSLSLCILRIRVRPVAAQIALLLCPVLTARIRTELLAT